MNLLSLRARRNSTAGQPVLTDSTTAAVAFDPVRGLVVTSQVGREQLFDFGAPLLSADTVPYVMSTYVMSTT